MTAAVSLDAWVRALPKAEMHLHFEGAFRWSTIRELHPDGTSLPARPPWLTLARPFPDFDDFRQVFRDYMLPVTGTPETIERHAFEVIEDLAREGVRYAEMIVSVDLHIRRGLEPAAVWTAIAGGRALAMTRYPVDVRLLLGISRHRPLELALAHFDAVASVAQPRGWLDGVDLQGDERLGEPRAFAEVFHRAAGAGLKLRAHAGELCGPESVRAAVFEAGVGQISHGVRAVEDPALVRELAAAPVYLHVCPTSNVLLECAPSLEGHQLRRLLDAGIACTVNADDPLLFGTDIANEYRLLIGEMGFSPREVAELAKNGFRASRWPAARIEALCAEIDARGTIPWP